MTKPDSPAGPEEKRALDQDELQMADQARQPGLGKLSDRDLSDLISRLRSRRNKARDRGDRQAREARGKAAPSGATAASGNSGTLTKLDYLDQALTRASEERDRRASSDDGTSQKDLAEKAMELKENSHSESSMKEDGGAIHPNDPEADQGGKNLEETERNTAPSGAFEEAGDLPARERSRTRY
ncbi:hypothetical protein MLD63_10715 [Paracoccus sp. TK19116]|uniref:Uncharacterized protein n=1 Tax=Paracoccus albicereus TaxID=2922394 RepID=A0ABT1MRG0_9RHOB|nr:hypothetical protein [Paracoccus albicereus]MCQ0970897.1 hypothetical protein [Paracoccus albicereus]